MQGEYVDVSAGGDAEFAAECVSIHFCVACRDFALRIPFAACLILARSEWCIPTARRFQENGDCNVATNKESEREKYLHMAIVRRLYGK